MAKFEIPYKCNWQVKLIKLFPDLCNFLKLNWWLQVFWNSSRSLKTFQESKTKNSSKALICVNRQDLERRISNLTIQIHYLANYLSNVGELCGYGNMYLINECNKKSGSKMHSLDRQVLQLSHISSLNTVDI